MTQDDGVDEVRPSPPSNAPTPGHMPANPTLRFHCRPAAIAVLATSRRTPPSAASAPSTTRARPAAPSLAKRKSEQSLLSAEACDRLVGVLQQMELFEDAAPELLRACVQAATKIECAEGDTVLAEGTMCEDLYLVESGEFRTWHGEEPEAALPSYAAGDAFGLLALGAAFLVPRRATCTAGGVVHVLSRDALNSVFLPPGRSRSLKRGASDSPPREGPPCKECFVRSWLERALEETHAALAAASAQLDFLVQQRGVGGELGAMLLHKFKDQRALELTLKTWDKDRDGTISLPEFKVELQRCGILASAAAVESLFHSIDEAAEGHILLSKFKRRLLELKERSSATEAALTRHEEAVHVLRRRAELLALALHAEEAAAAAEARLVPLDDDLPVELRLWRLLQARALDAPSLMHAWDSNGDEFISVGEFRKHARNLGLSVGQREMEELHARLDRNGDGAVDLPEVKAFLAEGEAAMRARLRRVLSRREARAAHAARARARAAVAVCAAAAELRVARREAGVRRAVLRVPLELKLADALLSKGAEATARLLRSWSEGGATGRTISAQSFCCGVRQLGLEATDEEVRALFRHFDADGSRALEVKELRKAVKELGAAAGEVAKETAEERRRLADAQRHAAAAAAAVPRAEVEAEAEEEEEEEAEGEAARRAHSCRDASRRRRAVEEASERRGAELRRATSALSARACREAAREAARRAARKLAAERAPLAVKRTEGSNSSACAAPAASKPPSGHESRRCHTVRA
ncbi:hypothetical protein AB1Y20_008926 [Prymnesium parvum]|uniref:Calmodulin n=1 Tax=Prymnesium parvum TaxID=97485 RepID=A0AB34K319_PRYPA